MWWNEKNTEKLNYITEMDVIIILSIFLKLSKDMKYVIENLLPKKMFPDPMTSDKCSQILPENYKVALTAYLWGQHNLDNKTSQEDNNKAKLKASQHTEAKFWAKY